MKQKLENRQQNDKLLNNVKIKQDSSKSNEKLEGERKGDQDK